MRNQIECAIRKLSAMQSIAALDESGTVRPGGTEYRKFVLNAKPAPVKLTYDIRNYWKRIQTA